MKVFFRYRVWLFLAMAGLLSSVLMATPAPRAYGATGIIALAANDGAVGTAVSITGSGFTPGVVYSVRFASVAVTTGTTDTTGALTDELIVPSHPGGRYSVTVTTTTDTSNVEYFTVTPEITLDSTSGRSGSQVKISGSGFKASSSISILFDAIVVGSVVSDTSGGFANVGVTIPTGSQGKYTVTGKDILATSPGVSLNVSLPEISLSHSSGHVGDTIRLIGSGFSAGATVTILFDAVSVGTVVADSGGSFTNASVTVPTGSRGKITVTGKDSLGASEGVTFTVAPPEITLGQGSGRVGESFTVSGSGFKPDSPITILFDSLNVGSVTADASGAFSNADMTVPSGSRGKHVVTAKDSLGASLGADFETVPGVTARVLPGADAASLEVNGSGFASNSKISIELDGVALAGSATASVNGDFSLSAAVPEAPAGIHSVLVRDANGNTATAAVSMVPGLAISPSTGPSGTVVKLSGTGFGAGSFITVKFNGLAVVSNPVIVQASSRGSFSASFEIPPSLPGSYTVEASDISYSAVAKFDSVLAATISQSTSAVTPGHVGMELTISGMGFRPNAKVIVTRATIQEELATGKTDANGIFLVDFVMPPSPGGEHTIIVTDGVNTREFKFFIEQEAPQAPHPLLPDADEKPAQPVRFDWKDVSDESGVTYTIQIAADELFSSVLFEEEGLEDSDFTLPEGELKSVTKENPYYWRVKAIDGASNVSKWSEARSFSLGFILSLPNGEPELILSAWWVYGLSIFIVAFIFIGFLLGRRTAR